MPPAVLAPPPKSTAPAVDRPTAPLPPAPVAPDGGSVVLHGVTWADYERLLEIAGDGPVRMTYDRGSLEITMLSQPHERLKTIAHDFITAFTAHHGITVEPTASTTWRREDVAGGLEADESYYFGDAARKAAAAEIDLTRDPPPELAVEIDLNPPRVAKQSVYARLGVPELWRWRDGRLSVLLRTPRGRYAAAARSRCLPDFPLARLSAALADPTRRPVSELTAAFRRALEG